MRSELAHDGFECLFVLANKHIELLVLVEEILILGEDGGVGLFEFCSVCFCGGV
jgi:hypothetical protein